MTKRMSELAEEIATRPIIDQDTAYELLDGARGVSSLLSLIAEGLWEDCPYFEVHRDRITKLHLAIAKAEGLT